MYIDKSLNHGAIIFVSYGVAFLIGCLLPMFLPLNNIIAIIQVISTFLFKTIVYFTIPYLFFSLLISTYELSKTHQLRNLLFTNLKTGFLLLVAITSISIVLFQFIPNQNFVSLVSQQESIDHITPSSIINSLFSIQSLETGYASQVILIPLILLAIIIGSGAKNTIDARHPILDICNGIRAINLKILEFIFPVFSIGVLIMTTYNISTIVSNPNIANMKILIIFLSILAFTLTFIIYPILLWINKINIHFLTWCKQILPAIATGFAVGNMTSAVTALLNVEEVNNAKLKISDTTIALSFVFSRVGTAVTIALSYIMIGKIYTAIPLNVLQLLIILLGAIFLSYLTNAVPFPIILASIVTLSRIPTVMMIQDLYLSLLPIIIFLHCIASVINIATTGFMKLYIVNKISKQQSSFDLAFVNESATQLEKFR